MIKNAVFLIGYIFFFAMNQMTWASTEGLGSLFWGRDPSTGQPWGKEQIQTLLKEEPNHIISKRVRRFFVVAKESINYKVSPVEKLEFEGIVFSDHRYKKSAEAVKDFRVIFSWTVCASFEGRELSSQCTKRAREGIRAWIENYNPDGNPINQNQLIPLLDAIDIADPILTQEDQFKKKEWLRKILFRGDSYFEGKKPTATTATIFINNHKTWHLAVQGMVARMLGDNVEIDKTRRLFNEHVIKNLNADGASLDFYQRDALHYHVYNLEAYIYYLLFTERNMNSEGQERVFKALDFLKPYFLGEKKHVEFAKTSVKFDIVRKDAEDNSFQNKPWEPKRARKLLRLSRALFKERNDFDEWTRIVVDEDYEPFIKLLTALNGVE